MAGPDTHGDERNGLLFALAGFAMLSLGDAVVKSMAQDWAPSAIATLRYVFGTIGLVVLLVAREGRAGFALPHPLLQFVRGLCIAVASIGFFFALRLMPLAEATTINFASPVITAMLAPLFLGESARLRTWIASLIAFVGVVIVLRPNVATMGVFVLVPLAAAFAMSCLFIANRALAGRASALAMQASLAMAATPIMLAFTVAGHVSGYAPLAVTVPSASVVAKCALVACTASTGHWLIYLGTTRAGASTIAPMTYVQLIVASILGWLVFGHRPEATTVLGAAIIVGAGVYLWRAGRYPTPTPD